MKFNPGRLFAILPWIAALLACVFLLESASVLGRSLGFFQDELWDYIPAVGLIKSDSLFGWQETRIWGHVVPLVTGPYQGALKAWVSAPLLAIAGTSTGAILGLNLLFSMIYLASLYWAVLPAAGRRWAWLVFLSPFLDTNFLITGPMDMGPSLFQDIFISLALGVLLRMLSGFQLKRYWTACFLCGCILAQKFTAIPVVISLLLMTAIVSVHPLWKIVRSGKPGTAVKSIVVFPALLFLTPLIPHLLYFHKTGLGPLWGVAAGIERIPFFDQAGKNLSFLSLMFGGGDWYQRITLDSAPPVPPSAFAWLSLVAMAGALILVLFSRRSRPEGKYAVAGIGLGLCSFLWYPAFRGLTRPWHFYVLTPLIVGTCVMSCVYILNCGVNRFRKLSKIFATGLTAVFVLAAVTGTAHGVHVLSLIESHQGVCITSPALSEAYRTMKAAGVKKIYTINYSIGYPIYVLSKGSIQVEDISWADMTRERLDGLMEAIRSDPDTGIVYRYCACSEGDAEWIRWLNHDPEIYRLWKRLDSERESLERVSIRDRRKTEFVLIRSRSAPVDSDKK